MIELRLKKFTDLVKAEKPVLGGWSPDFIAISNTITKVSAHWYKGFLMSVSEACCESQVGVLR